MDMPPETTNKLAVHSSWFLQMFSCLSHMVRVTLLSSVKRTNAGAVLVFYGGLILLGYDEVTES